VCQTGEWGVVCFFSPLAEVPSLFSFLLFIILSTRSHTIHLRSSYRRNQLREILSIERENIFYDYRIIPCIVSATQREVLFSQKK
jgi:hypothetical protein